jgi:hypothetical protein
MISEGWFRCKVPDDAIKPEGDPNEVSGALSHAYLHV